MTIRPERQVNSMIRVFCEAIRAENERALVGARMASLKKGGAGGSTVIGSDSPRGLSVPAVTMARAAELAGSYLTGPER
jgi:hypothetical protein